MLESSAGAQRLLASPLTGEVVRRNEALLGTGAAGAAARQRRPLWLLDVAALDAGEWDSLPPAA